VEVRKPPKRLGPKDKKIESLKSEIIRLKKLLYDTKIKIESGEAPGVCHSNKYEFLQYWSTHFEKIKESILSDEERKKKYS